jgi:hypothetical protein
LVAAIIEQCVAANIPEVKGEDYANTEKVTAVCSDYKIWDDADKKLQAEIDKATADDTASKAALPAAKTKYEQAVTASENASHAFKGHYFTLVDAQELESDTESAYEEAKWNAENAKAYLDAVKHSNHGCKHATGAAKTDCDDVYNKLFSDADKKKEDTHAAEVQAKTAFDNAKAAGKTASDEYTRLNKVANEALKELSIATTAYNKAQVTFEQNGDLLQLLKW